MAITHNGMNCDATLDVDAGTLTLVHSGFLAQAHKRDASPRVIPLGAIESVDFAKTNLVRRGWVRVILRGRSGYHQQVLEDVNGYLLKGIKDDTAEPFVQAVRDAMASAPPVDDYGAPGTPEETRPGLLERTENLSAQLDAKKAELEAAKAEREAGRVIKFMGLKLKRDTLDYKRQTFPIAGAKATIESSGVARSRMSATRVIGGGALLGGRGALLGALGRKDTSTVFLTIELADGAVLVEEISAKTEGDARRFIANLNTRSARAQQANERSTTTSLPPPPAAPVAQGPPPGFYPDPSGTPNTRWWDGTTWTDHIQPNPEQ